MTVLPVDCRLMPVLLLPLIRLRSAGAEPPIIAVGLVPLTRMPVRFGVAAVPVSFVPILQPAINALPMPVTEMPLWPSWMTTPRIVTLDPLTVMTGQQVVDGPLITTRCTELSELPKAFVF